VDLFSKVGRGMVLHVSGTEYEQGKQQGEKAADLIAKNVARFKNAIRQYDHLNLDYGGLIRRNTAFLEKREPGVAAEIQGIADGSGIPYEDILLINIPLYFILKWLPQECSQFLAWRSATLDGKTYLVKTRDMGGEWVEHVILRRAYADGKVSVEVNGAGIVTYPGSGMNRHGLAVSTSGVWSHRMTFDLDAVDRAHALLNSRHILEKCRTVEDAVDYLNNEPRMSGMNFVVADKHRAAALEVTRDRVIVSGNDDGIIVRTNHYVAPELRHLNPDAESYPSTYKRYERAVSFLRSRAGAIRFQDMLEIATDHENGPVNTICRHAAEPGGAVTIYCSIMIPEDGQVWTSLINPCEALRLTYI